MQAVIQAVIQGVTVARDIILTFTIAYSFLIILTALVKYWHQAKNVSMTWAGQVVLGLYLCFLMLNKLTTVVSLIVSSQNLSRTSGRRQGSTFLRILLNCQA